jgi:hypothetical protein
MMTDPVTSLSPRVHEPGASLAFRTVAAIATSLLVLLWTSTLEAAGFSATLPWAAAVLALGLVAAFADKLLAVLVVGIPPGLFVLWMAGLLTH